jgi:arginine decarboxylase
MSEARTTGGGAARLSFSQFYNASQLRADTWSRLKHDALRLDERLSRKADIAKARQAVADALDLLEPIESHWAFPGRDNLQVLRKLFDQGDYATLARFTARIVRALSSDAYRRRQIQLRPGEAAEGEEDAELAELKVEVSTYDRPYLEVLVVDAMSTAEEQMLRQGLRQARRPDDPFIYELVVVPSFQDALIALLTNYNIQSVVIRYSFPYRSPHQLEVLQRELARIDETEFESVEPSERGVLLSRVIGRIRPELCVYLVTDASVEEIAGKVPPNCLRVFYQQEDFLELHLNILRGVNARYQTPFFTALKHYSRQPTGVFHAMPISRGKSVTKSHWIRDMGQFYGMNIFLAETSATSGGLDSLLEPTGPIKKAQELAARAFGAQRTYFVTNGTSTANKIVVQALIKPGDIVLVDRDCHKSHHYGLVLSGAHVIYLDSYPLHEYSMYGAVPLREIKHVLLRLRHAGKLDRVKLLLLTNCTFDGIVYNVERVMEECLAIKPDLVFLWDEAWFAFARCGVTYRQRTAMATAGLLRERYRTAEYRSAYEAFRTAFDPADDEAWLATRLLPDPERVRIRAYATQSTHKTLTCLRQGSMIHVFDQDFQQKAADTFHEAYMTHTSTSPNYQILASLDVGRRQVELEGFELVKKQLEMAMVLRERVANHPLLAKYFRFLAVKDMIPERYRESGIEYYYDRERGWTDFFAAWRTDEFALDPTRLTLFVGLTGVDGDTFKNAYLMDKYGIQINKTSRNSVLFMTNIGTTRSSVAYLIEVLHRIAEELEATIEDSSPAERAVHERKVRSLTKDLPALPDFSRFHEHFRPEAQAATPEGDMRKAFFMAYDDSACEYVRYDGPEIDRMMESGREIVSAIFVIPYPPGFPILVPGQVLSRDILEFLRKLDVKEIHGIRHDLGLRIFKDEALRGAIQELRAAAE